MAVYSRLLFRAGGGVTPPGQRLEQVPNTVSLLIGLGGAGVHCVRCVKTRVHELLRPDGPERPSYAHIRFLGADAATRSKSGPLVQNPGRDSVCGVLPLEDGEFFSLENRQLAKALRSREALERRKDLSWLDYDRLTAPEASSTAGVRQIGRFLFMDRSADFSARLSREIALARRGLDNPRVNVHIFTSLGGGTGAGCFLDACYIARALGETGGDLAVFGYFFLPEVSLSSLSPEYDALRRRIRANAYAALRELDYCMGLDRNGGAFQQIYQGGRSLPWDGPPVDLCTLIGAEAASPGAYGDAMEQTADYVARLLTKAAKPDLREHLALFREAVRQADSKKTRGFHTCYCTIGSARVRFPLREIHTWLSSELFARFTPPEAGETGPGEGASLFRAALGGNGDGGLCQALWRELRGEEEDPPYPGDWKQAREQGPQALPEHYAAVAARRRDTRAAKLSALMEGEDSLAGRIRGVLEPMVRDPRRGPWEANRLAGGHGGLRDLSEALWKEYTASRKEDDAQAAELRRALDTAREDFETHHRRQGILLDNDHRRFTDYEEAYRRLSRFEADRETWEDLGKLLSRFRAQASDLAGLFGRLSRVTDTLLETFRENREALRPLASGGGGPNGTGTLLSLADLRPGQGGPLDRALDALVPSQAWDKLMETLLRHEDAWVRGDENRIAALVTDYCQELFPSLSGEAAEALLREKAPEAGAQDLLRALRRQAAPAFPWDSTLWQTAQSLRLEKLSVPPEWEFLRSGEESDDAAAGEVTAVCAVSAFPLCAYAGRVECARAYDAFGGAGLYSYEGRGGMDWRYLPPLSPQSALDPRGGEMPEALVSALLSGRALYTEARRYGILDGASVFCRPYGTALDRLRQAAEECRAEIARWDAGMAQVPAAFENLDETGLEAASYALRRAGKGLPDLDAALDALRRRMEIPMERTETALPADGDRRLHDIVLRVQEDHFFAFPAFHPMVREILGALETALAAARTVAAEAEGRKQAWQDRQKALNAAAQGLKQARQDRSQLADAYCDALCTGVLVLRGDAVLWPRPQGREALALSGPEYPYGRIPLYQGFLSFLRLPEEQRSGIAQEVRRRYRREDALVDESGARLARELTADRKSALFRDAGAFDNEEEIGDFLEEFIERFDAFRLKRSIE